MNSIISHTFQKSLAKLSGQEQKVVKTKAFDLQLNPSNPGMQFHRLTNAKDPNFWSIRVSRDIRIIVRKTDSELVLCYVDHHDPAYRWAERRQIETNPKTGAVQIVYYPEVIREEVKTVVNEVEEPALFADENDDYLLALGVPASWLGIIKEIDEAGLYGILDRLPEEAAESLIALYQGQRPKPAIVVSGSEAIANPFDHPDSQRRFWIATDERALERALDFSWEYWIVFLHPLQREAVTRVFDGPARVSGGAGTGKTVVALHRAVRLAEASNDRQVLLTTYSKPLVRHLELGLDRLVGPTGDVRRRIKVEHLHKFANDIAKEKTNFSFSPITPSELDQLLNQAIDENPDVKATKEFLKSEFDSVIDYWGVKNWEGYRDIQRTGRGGNLSINKRKELWPVFEALLKNMRMAGKMTFSDLAEAGQKEIQLKGDPPFNCIVVDEAQDFGPRELRFLMALAPIGSDSHYFARDVDQRIYRYPFSWVDVGIDVQGRDIELLINYRTTRQIKDFADKALGVIEEEGDDDEFDSPSLSLLTGPSPTIEGYQDHNDEVLGMTEWLQELMKEGFSPNEIAIFARTRKILDDRAIPAIEVAGLTPQHIYNQDITLDEKTVFLGTLHAAKGLEYRAVGLIGCEADLLPHPLALASGDDQESKVIAQSRELKLFYVGCTRPRDILRISYTGEPSPFLARLLSDSE